MSVFDYDLIVIGGGTGVASLLLAAGLGKKVVLIEKKGLGAHIYPTFSDVIKQPAKLCYVDKLKRNPFLKLPGTFLGPGKECARN